MIENNQSYLINQSLTLLGGVITIPTPPYPVLGGVITIPTPPYPVLGGVITIPTPPYLALPIYTVKDFFPFWDKQGFASDFF